MATETQIAFEGTKEEQELASRAFDIIKRKHLSARRQRSNQDEPVPAIVEALTKPGGPMAGDKPDTIAPKLEKALRHNSAVFAEGDNGDSLPPKRGTLQMSSRRRTTHTFKQRLNTDAKALDAEAAKEYQSSLVNRTTTRAERSTVLESVPEMPAPSPIRPIYPAPVSTPYSRSNDIPTLIPQAHVVKEREPEEVQAAPAPVTPAVRPQEPAAAPPAPVAPAAHAAAPAAAPQLPPRPPSATPQAQSPAAVATHNPCCKATRQAGRRGTASKTTEPAPTAPPQAQPQQPAQARPAPPVAVEEAPAAQAARRCRPK